MKYQFRAIEKFWKSFYRFSPNRSAARIRRRAQRSIGWALGRRPLGPPVTRPRLQTRPSLTDIFRNPHDFGVKIGRVGQHMSHPMRQNEGQMPRKSLYYTPKISRFLVSVLYHEARSRRMPMTELTEALLTKSLEGSRSWRAAEASLAREEPASLSAP